VASSKIIHLISNQEIFMGGSMQGDSC